MTQNSSKASTIDYLPVLKYGNPILRKKVLTIEDFTIVPEMVKEMNKTMQIEHGIGLAANQLGWSLNLFIIDIKLFIPYL